MFILWFQKFYSKSNPRAPRNICSAQQCLLFTVYTQSLYPKTPLISKILLKTMRNIRNCRVLFSSSSVSPVFPWADKLEPLPFSCLYSVFQCHPSTTSALLSAPCQTTGIGEENKALILPLLLTSELNSPPPQK